MSRLIARPVVALLCVLCVPVLAVAQGAGPARPTVAALHDGVVIDPFTETAFVMAAEGGIEALDLASRTIKWKSSAVAKPLMMVEGTLVVQVAPGERGELQLAALDPSRGAMQKQIAVELPAGVRAEVWERPAESFRVRAFQGAEGTAIVTWTFSSAPLSGVSPQREAPSAGRASRSTVAGPSRTQGGVRLDLTAGRATSLSTEDAERLLQRPEPRLPARMVPGGARQLSSADQRHRLRSERAVDASRWWAPYRWTLVDAEGGTVGVIEAPVSMAPFVIVGSRLLYVAQPSTHRSGQATVSEPLRLRALDVRSGAELWAVPVTDSAYRGAMPP